MVDRLPKFYNSDLEEFVIKFLNLEHKLRIKSFSFSWRRCRQPESYFS